MSEIAVECDRVWKKFKKGEIHDSLRDLLPAMVGVLFSRNHRNELHEGEFWALKDVSFQVRRGEAVGIIGPNGAGKSTILKLLSGILEPTLGKVQVKGRLSALIEVGAGFHPDLTGRENIYLNGAILGMRKSETDRKLDEIIAFSGLEDFIDTPVKRYSSGMYARLGFSVAAHVDPEVLLVDEVLSVGDFAFQGKCMRKMKETMSKGATVVYISHNVNSVVELCPRTILLTLGTVQKFAASGDVSRLYHRAHADIHRADTSIRLEQFELLSSEEKPCSGFEGGDWARLKLQVSSPTTIHDLVMGFFIIRSDGVTVFDTNSQVGAPKRFSIQKDQSEAVTLDFRVNLPKGDYLLGVNFWKGAGEFYLYEDDLVRLQVINPLVGGCAFVDTKWQ